MPLFRLRGSHSQDPLRTLATYLGGPQRGHRFTPSKMVIRTVTMRRAKLRRDRAESQFQPLAEENWAPLFLNLGGSSDERFPMQDDKLHRCRRQRCIDAVPVARSQTVATQMDQPNRVSVTYVAPKNPNLQKLYDLLRDRRALEKIQEILSPFRLPEEITIRTAECDAVNAYYGRENSKPTVTICYELLQRTLDSLPSATTPAGVSPADAEVGQFLWVALHEVGHAIADIFDLPIFGHEEDAADNFATYIMLQFGKEPAR